MITDETIEFAYTWFSTGVRHIENQSMNLGLAYLDKSTAVFSEIGDERMLTYSRHYKMLGLKLDERFEEAQSLFADIMAGYQRLDEEYGKALALTHLGECVRGQGQQARAIGHFHLATFIADHSELNDLLDYIHSQYALACLDLEDLYHAAKLLQRAEALAESRGRHDDLNRHLQLRAEIMVRMGEVAEATMLLEDVKNRLFKQERFTEAVEPLNWLRHLYERSGMVEDVNRTKEMLHMCGQLVLQQESTTRGTWYIGPPISQRAA